MQQEGEILDVLEWLWDALAEPVLNKLGYHGPPGESGKWPRLLWCPTGILSLLPIHAAGYHRDDKILGRSVLERVVSAYTSTIRALKFSRDNMKESGTGNVFIAAMPFTPNMARLRLATREAFGVSENLRELGNQSRIKVQRKGVSVEDVYEQLPDVSVAHFICHAILDEENPSSSRLVLANGTVTVSDISQVKLRSGVLK